MYSAGGLNWTPRIGRIRGMDIKVHLLLVGMVAFYLLTSLPSLILFAANAITIAAFLGLILWHELGHAFAARRTGLSIAGILLWPLGGECQIVGGMPSPKAEVYVSLAGPAFHFLVVLAVTPLLFLPESLRLLSLVFLRFWVVALVILVFNLLPMFPLDGGRVFRALLAYKLGAMKATKVAVRVGQVCAGLTAVAGVMVGHVMLAVLAAFLIIAAENELRAVMHAGYVYQPDAVNIYARELGIRQDWSEEAVRGYGRADGKKPGFFARWRTKRQLKKLARETERREKMKAEVDRILEKVSREGMPSLTAKERKILKQASGEYRKN
ncbi:MAG: site-2 protease family protein [Planctomycetota bacterium]|jgi:Zn-dependent protease